MPASIDRHDVLRLVGEGAVIVDVLPAEEYDELHIAGALGIPLRELDDRAPHELDRGHPVIVYCHDYF